MLDQLLIYLNIPWVSVVVGTIIGIIGIFSPKIFKNRAKPVFQKASLRLIGSEEDSLPENVEILFDGKRVNKLTRTNLIIWNDGNEVLRGDDIVEKDPLLILFDDGEILSYEVIKSNNLANSFDISRNGDSLLSLKFTFDYLNPKDGVCLGIIHTSQERFPQIIGSIKGVKKGFTDYGRVPFQTYIPLNIPFLKKINPSIFLTLVVILGVFSMYFGTLSESERKAALLFPFESSKGESIMLIVSGAIYAIGGLLMVRARRRKYPKELDSMSE
ncbi:MAG: hypothetical protein Q8N01_10965 [Sulfuricurvum sp.]|nr:hypothetical protein [Sulfuricurvum sp.]